MNILIEREFSFIQMFSLDSHVHTIDKLKIRNLFPSYKKVYCFLFQAEESLRSLHSSIPPHHASKIQVLLHQVQSLHQAPGTKKADESTANQDDNNEHPHSEF